jgi:hypothetical protein
MNIKTTASMPKVNNSQHIIAGSSIPFLIKKLGANEEVLDELSGDISAWSTISKNPLATIINIIFHHSALLTFIK